MDWCGHQVITAAINKRIHLEGRLNGTTKVNVSSFAPFKLEEQIDLSNQFLDTKSDFRYVQGVIKAFQEDRRYQLRGMDLRFYENPDYNLSLPAGKGLSSSAAMSVVSAGLIDLLHSASDNEILSKVSEEQISLYAKMAYIGERMKLGINCGQMDPYACSYGGFLHIDCKEPIEVEKIPANKDLRLVIGDTKQPKDTPKILRWLGERLSNKEPLMIEGVQKISEIVSKARHELFKKKPNIIKIGELMNENQEYIKNNLKISGDCPISPSNLEILIKAAKDAGAYGAKVTGSGGGGCMVALCSEDNSDEVSREIEKAEGEATINEIPDRGFRIEQ